jgi:L-malate glycosyltransferase
MRYRLLILKRIIEELFILPFVIWGRLRAGQLLLDEEFDIFFFFPFYHIGGAEKVHSQICSALKNRKAVIFFTRKSGDEFFLDEFKASGHRIIDISAFTDNKWQYWNNLVYRGILSFHINRQKKKTVVFNGQCNFAYKLSPWIKKEISQLELIHSLNSFSNIRIPYIPFYKETIMISKNRINDHIKLYEKAGIPELYAKKIHYIINGIPLPGIISVKPFSGRSLKLLYAGRGTVEKRVHLVAGISNACQQLNLPVSVTYMGEVSAAIPAEFRGNARFLGNINDAFIIDNTYRDADVLLVTSSEEGFPMVVMEAMARGCIILATPVGDLPVHIKNGVNGFLFSQVNDEKGILDEGIKLIWKLLDDPTLCATISGNNIKYAAENFGLATFESNYQKLFDTYLS